MGQMQLNILGCGSAKPSVQHMPACQVLNVRGGIYMIDCGEGAQINFEKMRIGFNGFNNIFISHLHGDHCFGLFGLLSSLALSGNKGGKIVVHCHHTGVELFTPLINFFCNRTPFEIEFNPLSWENALIYEDSKVRVRSFQLDHGVPSVGFVFEEITKNKRHIIKERTDALGISSAYMNTLAAGGDITLPDGRIILNADVTTPPTPPARYAYCSDTKKFNRVIEQIEGVDMLYHEATYAHDQEAKAAKRFHSTAMQAAEIARDAKVGTLLLGHYSKIYKDATVLLNEARTIFPNTHLTNELQRWKI